MTIVLLAFGISEWIAFLFLLAIFFIPNYFYVVKLQKLWSEISIKNQTLSKESFWLLLIPLVSLVWHFIVVNRLAKALEIEFKDRNLVINENTPGKSLGITMCVLRCIPYISLVGLILWIIYWSKMSTYYNWLKRDIDQKSASNHQPNFPN